MTTADNGKVSRRAPAAAGNQVLEDVPDAVNLPAPPVVEFGRYRVYEAPDGLVLARATDTCERCQACGCGDQQPRLQLPDVRRGRQYLIQWMMHNANGGILGSLRAVLAGHGAREAGDDVEV